MLFALDLLIKKYAIPPTGVIHVGAHHAEEAGIYRLCGFKKVLWIEGNPALIPNLEKKLQNFSSQKVYQALIDIEEKETVFHLTNDPQSSSLYKLKEHATQYPSVTVEKEITCITQRLDTFLKLNAVEKSEFNFLNLDIQGNELNALKSLGEDLEGFHFIYTEVQLTELYAKSPNLNDMDRFLFSKGYTRTETNLQYRSWGDALYIKTKDQNAFSNFLKRSQSNLLVLTWPLRKRMFWLFDQSNYFLGKLFKKKQG